MNWLNSWASFVKVVEAGSMAAAARRLDCTRAQVSKQVGELEQAFGVRLLERTTRRLSLTPSGEVFYQHALRALEAVESTELAVRNLGDVPRGVLRISAPLTFGRLYVAPLLPRIAARYPHMQCELVLTDQLVDLAEGRIDLALRITKLPPEDAVARKLVFLQRVLCAAPAYLAGHGEPRLPADLVEHPCFDYSLNGGGPSEWILTDHQGEESTVRVSGSFQINNIDCIQQAVLDGHGIGILPTYLCAPELARGSLQVVLGDYEPRNAFGQHLYACYTPSRVRLPRVRVFLDELELLLSPLPPWERAV